MSNEVIDDFHAHLDKCQQCREQVFNLCQTGYNLLLQVPRGIENGLRQWNTVLRNAEGSRR